MRHYAKLFAATLTASSLTLVAMAGAMAGPVEFFQGVYQDLLGPTQFEKAKAAYDSRDYPTAMQQFWPLAEQGEPSAQFYLGVMYEHGMGVRQSYVEAAKWLRLAAEGDYAPAFLSLAELYDDGLGVPKNKAEAMRWYCRAAEDGDPLAQNYLGSIPGSLDELCPK